jgi:hypothetical protein
MKIRQGQEHFSTAPAITNPRLQSFDGIPTSAGPQTRNRPFPQVKGQDRSSSERNPTI